MQKYFNLVDLEKRMLINATTLAIVAVRTAENEPLKVWGDLSSLVGQHLTCAPGPRPRAEPRQSHRGA